MSLTLTEIDRQIEAQLARIQNAMASGDDATVRTAQQEFLRLRALRAEALIEQGSVLVSEVEAATTPVATATARIADPLALFGVAGLAQRAGLPAVSFPPR